MKILLKDQWCDGYLDYHRHDDEYRCRVLGWVVLRKLSADEIYFVRPKSIRMVVSYVGEVGARATIRKIRSRRQEKFRNEKYLSLGFGTIVESPKDGTFDSGRKVAFLAPCHPRCVERIVSPEQLLFDAGSFDWSVFRDNELAFIDHSITNQSGGHSLPAPSMEPLLESVMGWTRYSGVSLDQRTRKLEKSELTSLQSIDWNGSERFSVDPSQCVNERHHMSVREDRELLDGRKRAVVFGYGNYAKTITLPFVRPYFSVECIHEIDPTQLPASKLDGGLTWDSSPSLMATDRYDAYLIAGYNHTHAPLAIAALNRDSSAVVEKPLVTSHDQLTRLLSAMEVSKGSVFTCYNRRYMRFNEYLRSDLEFRAGDPLSYHCIVYQEPLPPRHWVNWPLSGSRIVNNGCHWLDHFLFLNGYADFEDYSLRIDRQGTVHVHVDLKNGASFSMVLTDAGSQRLGMQEHVEVRANGKTAKIINCGQYRSEGRHRVIRRSKIKKIKHYREMYRSIGQSVVQGSPGDTIQSVSVLNSLMLSLNDLYESKSPSTPVLHPKSACTLESLKVSRVHSKTPTRTS